MKSESDNAHTPTVLRPPPSWRGAVDALTGVGVCPELRAVSGVLASPDGYWTCASDRVAIAVEGGLPAGGWLELGFTASSSVRGMVVFQIERQHGQGGVDAVAAGVVDAAPRRFRVFLHLGPWACTIRLVPPARAGSSLRITDVVARRRLGAHVGMIRELSLAPEHPVPGLARAFAQLVAKAGLAKTIALLKAGAGASRGRQDYEAWLERHALTDDEARRCAEAVKNLKRAPLISVIMPVFRTDPAMLTAAVDSVRAQIYPNWQLCLVDDASGDPALRARLEQWAREESRISVAVHEERRHITEASNTALGLAKGEFVATVDHDDVVDPRALAEVAQLLEEHPDADMVYTDEDHLAADGRRHLPYFKPDWSPDLFLSHMYTAHLAVYRTSLVRDVGGFRQGFEGAQDYDLVLRLTERTKRIHHIPTILYSWRESAQSTAGSATAKSYAHDAALRALREALGRRGAQAAIEPVDQWPGYFRAHWTPPAMTRVSIIIPTKDNASVLGPCLESIFRVSAWRAFEVIVVSNNSVESETFALLDAWKVKEPARFQWFRKDEPFNYSALNNAAAKLAKGDVLAFLNNDIEVVSPEWIDELAGQAMRPEVGAVGPVLLYPDGTIQHAGIATGIGIWAGHTHRRLPDGSPGYFGRLLGPFNVSAVTGACLFMRKKLFDELGGFDEQLAVACNDVELCIRALDRGLFNVVVPHVKLVHHESVSRGLDDSGEKWERLRGEVARVRDRWPAYVGRDPFYNPNLTKQREDVSIGAADEAEWDPSTAS